MSDQYILTPYYLDHREPGLESLAGSDWRVNAFSLPQGSVQRRMVSLYRPLADFVAETSSRGERPVSVAGDCCAAIGVLAGLQRAGVDPALIWFDAHCDFNTWQTTPSGFLGGMPLAMLAGLGEQTLVKGVGLEPLLEARILLSDGRALDPGERELLDSSAVTHLPTVEALLDYDLPDGPLYVHFDTDVINPEEAPAMNYRTPGGPTVDTLRGVFRRLADSGRVAAVSISCWNPDLDEDGRSQNVSMELLQTLLA